MWRVAVKSQCHLIAKWSQWIHYCTKCTKCSGSFRQCLHLIFSPLKNILELPSYLGFLLQSAEICVWLIGESLTSLFQCDRLFVSMWVSEEPAAPVCESISTLESAQEPPLQPLIGSCRRHVAGLTVLQNKTANRQKSSFDGPWKSQQLAAITYFFNLRLFKSCHKFLSQATFRW